MRFDGEELAGLTIGVFVLFWALTPPWLLLVVVARHWPEPFANKAGRALWYGLLVCCVLMWLPALKVIIR
jgi:hypothetical protein